MRTASPQIGVQIDRVLIAVRCTAYRDDSIVNTLTLYAINTGVITRCVGSTTFLLRMFDSG